MPPNWLKRHVSTILADARDTDPERETFVPTRLSDAQLQAALAAAGGGGEGGGNVLNWIGDSIAPPIRTSSGVDTVNGLGVLLTPGDFLAWAHLLSSAQIQYGKAGGVGGQRADQMVPRIAADALSHGGQFCGISTGTNDASAGRTPAQYAADIRAMCAAIVAAGQIPILTTGVPNPSGGATNYRQVFDRYRRFTIAYAIQNGWPLVDTYSALVDPATGGYLAVYDSGDGIHPNNAGKKVMGQALVDAMQPYLAPLRVAPAAWDTAAQTANLVPNPLFKTDTNADGVPDSWTKTGTLTVSTGTDPAVKGRWMRIQETASAGFAQVQAPITITGLPGHAIAVSGLFRVVGTSQTTLTISTSGAATNLNMRPISAWTEPTGDWRTFYLQATVPVGATSMVINFSTNGGANVDAYVAQLGVYDLTAAGF
jgi:lysophospholipase L1-like esterase